MPGRGSSFGTALAGGIICYCLQIPIHLQHQEHPCKTEATQNTEHQSHASIHEAIPQPGKAEGVGTKKSHKNLGSSLEK